MTPNNVDPNRIAGHTVLFIGVECRAWSPAQFAEAARNARALGIDTIAPKRADGGIRWYGDAARLRQERAATLAEGCGYLPFQYAYGPRFGDHQIVDETTILKEMIIANDGAACVDMEVEWNGQVAAAERFAALMRPLSGALYISTWADPYQQNWAGVVRALAPIASAWGPQQYNNFLAAQESQLIALNERCIQPAVDLTGEFGANDPVAIAKKALAHGQHSLWLWEYEPAMRNPTLVRSLVSVMRGAPVPPVNPPNPPGPPTTRQYSIESGDTLSGIATKLNLPNWFQDLYLPNRAAIEAAAHAHGRPTSDNGSLIFPGTVLSYRAA